VVEVDPVYTPEAQSDVRALGFDPYNGLGPLDDRFRPGVNDSVGPAYRPARGPHEIDAASVLAREGADVRLVREDHTQQDRKSIDAYLRWHGADHGTGTEFKSLISANNISRATKRAMLDGAAQLSQRMGRTEGVARGQVLIDARHRDLSVDGALQACRSAVGQANAHGQVLPAKVVMVLSDDTVCMFRPQAVAAGGGTTRYARPDESSFRHVTRDDRDWNDLWRQQ
jgi:hypothetical protein